MAPSKKRPAKIQVIRRGKTYEYALADETDWAIWQDNILQINAADGAKYYWPVDSVTLWKVTQ
jgi:hypothetical protein